MDVFIDKEFESLSYGIKDHCIAISEELRKHNIKFQIVITSELAEVKFKKEYNTVHFPKTTIGVDSKTCEKSLKFEDHQALVKAFKGGWEKAELIVDDKVVAEQVSKKVNGCPI